MLVRDVMTSPAATASPEELAEQAYAEMHLRGVHHLVVVRGTDLLGVISDRDLGGPHGHETRRGRHVRDLMVSRPICGTSDMSLRDAATRMRGHSIGCLPVVDGGRLVGIATASDLLEAIERNALVDSQPPHPLPGTEREAAAQQRDLRVSDLMRQPVEVVEPSTSVRNAAAQMAGRGVGFLPVCEGGGAVGVLTDRDIAVRVVAVGLDPILTLVDQVMTRRVHRCLADAPLSEARRAMEANRVRRLVVTDSAYRVVGVLSVDDWKALPASQDLPFAKNAPGVDA
jgi:CBS domain-containing protein